MVSNELEVLPTAAALDPDDGDPSTFDDELACLAVPRPSRPSLDYGWEEEDHYHTADADAPADAYAHGSWKEVYHDLDEIMVNGAMKLHWRRGMLEVQQIFARVKHVIGRDDVRRKDLTLYFLGPSHRLRSCSWTDLDCNTESFCCLWLPACASPPITGPWRSCTTRIIPRNAWSAAWNAPLS